MNIFKWSKLLKWIDNFDPRYQFIKTVPSNAKVLDLGCGKLKTLIKLNQHRPDIQWSAVDWIKNLYNIPKNVDYACINLDCDNLPFEDGKFDAIFACHILEHLSNPTHVILEINRILKKNGVLYIEVPSLISLFMPSFSYLKSDGNTLNLFDDYTHQKPYTKKAVQDFLKACGCKIIKVRSVRNLIKLTISPLLVLMGLLLWNRRLLCISLWEITGWANYGIGKKE